MRPRTLQQEICRRGGVILVITRETDYALRILRALLDQELHTVGELAKQELLPQPFTYKILKKLASMGLVQIVRGPAGGCRLAGNLQSFSLYDLLEATGDRSDLSACMEPGHQCAWRQAYGSCTIHCRLAVIQQRLDQELKRHSLLEILTGQPFSFNDSIVSI